MRVSYQASVSGTVDIDDEELEGLSKDAREAHIDKVVTDAAYEEVDSSLEWEIDEDE